MNIVSDFARLSVAGGGTHGGMESISTLKSDDQIHLEDSAALRLLHPGCPIRAMQSVYPGQGYGELPMLQLPQREHRTC